jgi:leucyl aminopeptidase
LLAAGEASGERLWRLPLWEAYEEDMKSDVADLLNSAGTREGGAILGATFLAPFAGRMPWAHLDIAGVGWTDGDRPHAVRGPVGFGVRLLLEWLSRRASNGA